MAKLIIIVIIVLINIMVGITQMVTIVIISFLLQNKLEKV